MEQGEIWWADLPESACLRSQTPAEAWECPEVKPKHLRGKQAASQPVELSKMPVAGD